jgi:hypothetical protein
LSLVPAAHSNSAWHWTLRRKSLVWDSTPFERLCLQHRFRRRCRSGSRYSRNRYVTVTQRRLQTPTGVTSPFHSLTQRKGEQTAQSCAYAWFRQLTLGPCGVPLWEAWVAHERGTMAARGCNEAKHWPFVCRCAVDRHNSCTRAGIHSRSVLPSGKHRWNPSRLG